MISPDKTFLALWEKTPFIKVAEGQQIGPIPRASRRTVCEAGRVEMPVDNCFHHLALSRRKIATQTQLLRRLIQCRLSAEKLMLGI